MTSTLVGRWTGIRPPTGADVQWLQERIVAGAFGNRSRFGALAPSVDELAQNIGRDAVSTMIIHRADSSDPIGIAQLFNYDGLRRTGRLSIAIEREAWSKAWPLEGLGLFVFYLFESFPLRTLYMEASAASLGDYGSGIGKFFVHEATLREHEWSEGRLQDMHILSMTREAWAEHRPFVEGVMRRSPVDA
jgi:RimJ/RimL family protein N-acetyltransferase